MPPEKGSVAGRGRPIHVTATRGLHCGPAEEAALNGTIATAPERRWLVDIRSRPDAAAAVRDYFLRLGISADLAAPGVVGLTSGEDELTLKEFTQNWAKINGIPVALGPADSVQTKPLPLGNPGGYRPKLGEVLRRKGLISERQLETGLIQAQATGELLGVVLLRLGFIFEDELARTLSEQLAVPYVSIGRVGVDRGAMRLLPPEVGLNLAAIPVRVKGDSVQIAFADPTDPKALEGVRAHVPRVSVAVAELSDIRSAWRQVAPAPRSRR